MQELPSGKELRLVFKLLHHWRDARGDGQFPPLGAVYRRPLGEVLRNMFELTVAEPGAEPAFRRIGDALGGDLPVSLAGQPISAAPATSLLAHAVTPYRIVLTRGLPMCIGGEFVDASGKVVLFRTVVMPVSEDGVRIDALLGGANGKVCEPGERPVVAAADTEQN